jgi:hypothetical protein
MVVKTRSYTRQVVAADAADAADAEHQDRRQGRRVKLSTPSFRDASIRTYKVYSPNLTPKQAADALVALQDDNTEYSGGCISSTCMNPMRPITQFMYCISVYNSDITLHYKTVYILYDSKTRLYNIYSIISNCVPETGYTETDCGGSCVDGYPAPVHTVQMKYITYNHDSIVNYIMTMIVPSKEYDYFIQDDIVGIVASNEELQNIAFSQDSSYYDIDHLFHDNTSRETAYGWKTFQLIPSRKYWGPIVDTTESAAGTAIRSSYAESVIHSVLLILSQSI